MIKEPARHLGKAPIVFLAPVATQPRYGKRILEFMRLGVSAQCLYFDRDYFSGRKLPCDATCLGRIDHGRYFSRILTLVKAAFLAKKRIGGADFLYAFGLDMLFLATIASIGSRQKILYEVSDIREAMTRPGLYSWAMRSFERLMLRWTDVIVVTAPGYRDGYYRGLNVAPGNRFFVMENKLDLDATARPAHSRTRRGVEPIRIGYFGLLRCPRSWEVLKELARRGRGRFLVEVRGRPIAPESIPAEAAALDGIAYGGEYVWPDDLAEMYDAVDMVWGCYPYSVRATGNWLWARTNRFYEACYFKRPLVTLKDSADAQIAGELGIGPVVDLSDIGSTVDRLLQLTSEQLHEWQTNVDRVDSDVCVYSDDHQRLLQLITSL